MRYSTVFIKAVCSVCLVLTFLTNQLLTHTGGFGTFLESPGFVRGKICRNSTEEIGVYKDEKLFSQPGTRWRYSNANPNTPISLLKVLSQDSIYSVRRNVAANHNCSVEILKELARDGWSEVREAVASNNNTPIDVLVYLSKDPYSSVRRALQDNHNTPHEIRMNAFVGLRPEDGAGLR